MATRPPPPEGAGSPRAARGRGGPDSPAGSHDGELARAVTAQCIELLRGTYLPRLQRALAELPPQDLWWRPHERSTSAGNLLLHLQGNIRQWIVSGLGGAPDHRERDAEFAARGGEAAPDAARLLAALAGTVADACTVIERLDTARLVAPITIQGFSTNGLGAVLHVTEHMSWHAGQITWIAKLRAGERHGIAFYDDAALGAARNAGRDAVSNLELGVCAEASAPTINTTRVQP